jgi:hypothetical protein
MVLSNNVGSVTLKNVLRVLPAVQSYPLPGASLFQGVYDARRNLYYFSDTSSIQVFSLSSGWKSAFNLPAASQAKRLWGIGLSPDNSHLAVADNSANMIYVIDPDNPGGAKAFPLPPISDSLPVYPCGVAITNDGQVFYVTEEAGYGATSLFRLDTNTGTVTPISGARAVDAGDDAVRILLAPDGARAYENLNGVLTAVDTSTGEQYENPLVLQSSDLDMALSTNATTLAAGGYVVDTDLGLQTEATENQLEAAATALYGEKLTPDGSLLISPVSTGLDLLDARTGMWTGRVLLPVTLAPVYDALVSDGRSNVLVAITGTGDGVVAADLSSVALPDPLPYFVRSTTTGSIWTRISSGADSAILPHALSREHTSLVKHRASAAPTGARR